MLDEISDQTEGTRNSTLNRNGFIAAKIADEVGLDVGELENELIRRGTSTGLDVEAVTKTVRSALSGGMKNTVPFSRPEKY